MGITRRELWRRSRRRRRAHEAPPARPTVVTTEFTARPRPSRRRRTIYRTVTVATVLVLTAGAGLTVDAARYASASDGRLLPGTALAGVAVGGLLPAEAEERVLAAVTPRLDRTVSLHLDGRAWTRSLAELGVTSDLTQRLDEAVRAAEVSWFDRVQHRYLGRRTGPQLAISLSEAAPGVRRWVTELADELDQEVVDARVTYDEAGLHVRPHQAGLRVDIEATTAAVTASLDTAEGDVRATLAVERWSPEVTTADFDRILFLDQSEHRLDLYVEGRKVRTYTVTTGTGRYPTPVGEYEITLKRPNPTWVNPAPNGWGRGMPRSIRPGPNNPLGLRALNWNIGAIRFHGTAKVNELGRDASHGCVRLSNDDIVELYDLVEVGTRIISVR